MTEISCLQRDGKLEGVGEKEREISRTFGRISVKSDGKS